MSPRFAFEYEFTEELAARAARSAVEATRRDLMTKFWAALPAPLVLTIIGTATIWLGCEIEMPDWLLILPIVLTALCGGALGLLLFLNGAFLFLQGVLRWRIRRHYGKTFPPESSRTVRWILDADKFETHSAHIDRVVPWGDVKGIRVVPEFLVISLKAGPEILLPAEHFTMEVQDLLREKAAMLSALEGDNGMRK